MLDASLWIQCLEHLKADIATKEFNLWILPLQAHIQGDEIILYAPNRYIVNWVSDKYFDKIIAVIEILAQPARPKLTFKEGSLPSSTNNNVAPSVVRTINQTPRIATTISSEAPSQPNVDDGLQGSMKSSNMVNLKQRFDNFVEGKSNQLAVAAARNVAENPGKSYNPFYIFGASGLGKTHLLHAIGNTILKDNPQAKVAIMHSERFVQDMVKALKLNKAEEFKAYYRSFDALLIDDIQFFAKKDRSQEEFFHTFNALLEGGRQIILTSDSYPREIDGVDERLKSRFGWGLTVEVEPPELETRAAILIKKAEERGVTLTDKVAFFIAERLRSNVRELEGALNRVIANANFTGQSINTDFVREALRDLISMQEKLITVENIKEAVAKYYNVSVKDLHSARRSRSIARPRQIAMALSRELTNRSLPEIGDAFGGRDHTTVIHACRQIKKLCEEDFQIKEDYSNLIRKFEP